ncbi:hemolysin-III related-domain-containing protein [Phakopsora pachyrhizi]|uniref:Haemolysin-III related-domain-containing protein n=1 Tax=Phakopsora pachyrhizi TaxID=170000 RepID=A0AAV0B5Q5_PHAPC|nr:hemolysin-III related-domain-containing protein [Phakopsora pachyrhizi]CAH7680928.1 Haemolysin-III related-domain-containing protein [Phakopsora pachyrhizi]
MTPSTMRPRSRKTIMYDQLQSWRQDNPHIRTGYRQNLPRMTACIKSVFSYFHNETVNIHTHLWGAITFIFLILTLQNPSRFVPLGYSIFTRGSGRPDSVTWYDTFVFGCFFLSGAACLGFSAMFHTFMCHSQKVCATFGRLDYIGIVWLIVGSFYPSIYYGFYCHTKTIITYLTLITVLGGMATYTVISPTYKSKDARRKRTLIFIALGLSAILPVGHGLYRFGLVQFTDRIGLRWLVSSGALYIAGALFYSERFPERFNPGRFDLIGSSHQIFHVLILVAASFHYISVSRAFNM